MAETMPRTIAAEVRELTVPRGRLAVWALGQQGYLIKGGATVIVVDPYLSDFIVEVGGPERLVPIVAQPGELEMVDLALATHHHGDHCDPRTLVPLLASAPSAAVWTSYSGRDVLLENGVAADRITVPQIDQRTVVNDELAITAIPSAHYTFEPDDAGNPAYLGFIVELNGASFYHPGDTILYEGLIERLRQYSLDLAFLPINGRDWFREHEDLTGNLDYREAAELAARLDLRVLIPGHNDMFAGNRINPAYLVDYLNSHYPSLRYHFLQAGELYYYVK